MHSSEDGHLGCFHVLGIVSSAGISYGIVYMWNLKKNLIQMNLYIKQK